jgi:hypothetical protein
VSQHILENLWAPSDLRRLEGPTIEVTASHINLKSTWTVPKALLSRYSDFFKEASNEAHGENQQQKISLKGIMPKSFQVFLQWIYFDTSPQIWESLAPPKTMWNQLNIWDLGCKLKASGFKDCVLTSFYNTYTMCGSTYGHFGYYVLTWCKAEKDKNCPLRKFLIHTLAQHWVYADYIEKDLGGWMDRFKECAEVHQEVFRGMVGMLAGRQHEVEVAPLEHFFKK